MRVGTIKPSGCSNTLNWALANGADIRSDISLQGLINEELFYLVEFKHVNFLELFRLTQAYRNRIRILNEYPSEVPAKTELINLFPGTLDVGDEEGSQTNTADVAEFVANSFVNVALQMTSDSDVIRPSTCKLFIPMICRSYDVQIPISFLDVIQSMTDVEYAETFNEHYPDTLSVIPENPTHGVITMLRLGFLKATTILKYNARMDKYLNYVKYSPLKVSKTDNRLYKLNLSGFHKYDNLSRGECRFSMFNLDKDSITPTLRHMNALKTDLEIEFVVQLPIQFMQSLEYRFDSDILKITNESSMSTIIGNGMVFNDFVAPEYVNDDQSKVEEHTNAVSLYKTRLAEANQLTVNCIGQILKDEEIEVDYTSAFALLPSIYMTNAILTLKVKDLPELIAGVRSDEVLSALFFDIDSIAKSVISDIESA